MLVGCFVYGSMTSCADSGGVGESYLNPQLNVVVDTVLVDSIETVQLNYYSGGRLGEFNTVGIRNISFGRYADPLFGTTEATGLIRPGIFTAASIDTIDENTRIELRIRPSTIQGDTISTEQFDLIEINRPWRGNAWTPDSSIVNSLGQIVTSFTITYEDSTVSIPLPQPWKDKLKSVIYSNNPDSAYQEELFGFAIMSAAPVNKMVSINAQSTDLLLENDIVEEDTSYTNSSVAVMRSWAFSFSHAGGTIPAHVLEIDNTLTNVLVFDIPADTSFLGTDNVLRAELVFNEDIELLETSIPQGERRPYDREIEIFLLKDIDTQFDVLWVTPSFTARQDADDREAGFRVNIANILNSQLRNGSDDFKFYMSYKSNNLSSTAGRGTDGTIFKTVLIAPGNGPDSPKLIITKAQR